MSRRAFLAHTATLAASTVLPDGAFAQGSAARPLKRLRVVFPTAETGFDPAQISDLYSAKTLYSR